MNRGIKTLFIDVPQTYELVNHVLTLGFDLLWRKKAVKIAAENGGARWLDVCSGTGETACLLKRLAPEGTFINAVDFSVPMLRKAAEKPEARDFSLTVADATALPFPDGSIDLVTISFATRNLNISRKHLHRAFSEFHRILKPGGRFVNTETSQPESWPVRKLFHLYVKVAVKPVGTLISGSKPAYTYLSRTIPRFYHRGELSAIMKEAGFSSVECRPLLFGAAAIHKAVK
ncbi:ubiquinone/menaquinone biosynthesis methyltransferase [Acidobacteriota bacterium]